MGNSSDSFPVLGEGPITCCAFTKSFIHSPERNLAQSVACLAQFWLAWLGFWITFLGGLHEHVLMINDKAQSLAMAWHSQTHIPLRMRQLDTPTAMKWCMDVDRPWNEECSKPHGSVGDTLVHWRNIHSQRAEDHRELPRGAKATWEAEGLKANNCQVEGFPMLVGKPWEWTSVLGLDLEHFYFL